MKLPSVNCRRCVAVSQSSPLGAAGYNWTVTFQAFDPVSASFAWPVVGNVASLAIVNSSLTCSGLVATVTTLQNGSAPMRGSFVLAYRAQPSVALAWNATPDDVLAAVQNIKSIPHFGVGFAVSRSDLTASGGAQWRITFPYDLPHPDEVFVVSSRLRGSNAQVVVTTVTPQTVPMAGSFTLSHHGQATAAISFNANASIVASALSALPGLPSVDVTTVHVSAMNRYVWRVTFASLVNSGNLPLLLTPSVAIGGTSPSATVAKRQAGTHNQIQVITISAVTLSPNGTFTLASAGFTSPIVLSMTSSASEMTAALVAIPSISTVRVERALAMDGHLGASWYVLFLDSSQDRSPLVVTPMTLTPVGGYTVSVTTRSSMTTPVSGTFTIAYGLGCIDGATSESASCGPQQTPALPYNVDAVTMQHEISLLPGLGAATVTRVGPDYLNGFTWSISFPQELGSIALLNVALGVNLVGTNAIVAVAETQAGVSYNNAKVPVTVSSNGQDYSSPAVVYQYVPTIVVSSLAPTHGPATGGTEVVVTGSFFFNSSALYCSFGSTSVKANTYFNNSMLVCIAPPRGNNAATVAVEISHNGVGLASTSSESKVRFTYDTPVVVQTVTPTSGPMTGNFSVHISGGPFLPTSEVRCRFGALVVLATYMHSDRLRCVAPSLPAGTYALEVSLNNQDYTMTRWPFYFYPNPILSRIVPVFGPATAAGTAITIFGTGFVNVSSLVCRLGKTVAPATFVSSTQLRCLAPALSDFSSGFQPMPLSEQRNTYPDPSTGSRLLFPTAWHFPLVNGRLVAVEVSNNQQDYTYSGVNFMYYDDATVAAVTPTRAFATDAIALFVLGAAFLNTTELRCRVGPTTVRGVFLTPNVTLCIVTSSLLETTLPMTSTTSPNDQVPTFSEDGQYLFVEVANNGVDFTANRVGFEYLGRCPTGAYCPATLQGRQVTCPRGTYCPGVGNANYTLCPRGTYQPLLGQSDCVRCPIGYHCPHIGLHVPRVCPAGYVCDVTGIEEADQPCPVGHFCLEGTATTATTCGSPVASRKLAGTYTQGERPSTLRKGRRATPQELVLGGRNAGCWDNSTADFGLQLSANPSRFWMELHQLPLSSDTTSFVPLRGRYCMDDACLKVQSPLSVQDTVFDYASTGFALRRPVPCPMGTYCHAGTAGNVSTMKNFTMPQPCFESMYCPEGSVAPVGQGDCPTGHYCPFGVKLPCPVGTYCPSTGNYEPLPCPPGTFNGMVGQSSCTPCPAGSICPGFNPRVAQHPLPTRVFCLEGLLTSDPFRNDTTLRPYPCRPGTYCLGGVVADTVVTGDFSYAQNCTAGFYCELASVSPKGMGMCPPGFMCPEGTAAPIPTPLGTYAQRSGTVQAAQCAPGYYAPTIETSECYPCPPGTTCQDDGMSVAVLCPPGTYRSTLEVDGIACVPCPQGTWSKNWGLRDVTECMLCPPGTVCATDGMTNPCSNSDLPLPYVPTNAGESMEQCLGKGRAFFFGVLLEPWIDAHGVGPHFLPHISGQCYYNPQPYGSPVYRRFTEYFGPLYDITNGIPSQGYGDNSQSPGPSYFDRGSLYMDLTYSTVFDLQRNCTRGFFFKDAWFPGTCEADLICYSTKIAQALICPEGFICDEATTDGSSLSTPCAPGYVCAFGSTPDTYLESPQGQYSMLCPRAHFCLEGTGEGFMKHDPCPANYFCPTGTVDPWHGLVANDALRRGLSSALANPFTTADSIEYVNEGDVRGFSAHDLRCLLAIDPELQETFQLVNSVVYNVAIENDLACARDHKWRHVVNAITRGECNCTHQVVLTLDLHKVYSCTLPSCALSSLRLVLGATSAGGVTFPFAPSAVYASYTALAADATATYKAQTLTAMRAPISDTLYDTYMAVQRIASWGASTPTMFNVDGSGNVLRPDFCECQRLLKCPNGTTSPIASDDIFDCVKTGVILERIDLIPPRHPRQLNGTDYNPYEVATVTINATGMDPNMTYNDHYRFSVYKNCKPCPPNYSCNLYAIPPACTYPGGRNTTGIALYNACLASASADVCDAIPFFCETRSKVNVDGTLQSTPGCCACEHEELPVFFQTNAPMLGFPDDKHGMVQFTITAVAQVDVTIVAELFHGLYYRSFAEAFATANIHLSVFTPSRAYYTPTTPTSNAFLPVLQSSDFTSLALPLNLPMSRVRIPGSLSFQTSLETSLFIDRIADVFVGDPTLPSAVGFTRLTGQQALLGTVPNGSTQVLPTNLFGNKIVPDPLSDVAYSSRWWLDTQPGGVEAIALPYLPYFSACAGYDSHMSLAKLLETHPDCVDVDYNVTRPVDELLWRKKTVPLADTCKVLTSGIELQCVYEEDLEGGTDQPRWYEADPGTKLFWLTRYPIAASDFVGNASSSNPIYWGETDVIMNLLGTSDLVGVALGPKTQGYSMVMAQTVALRINYYQITEGQKILVNAQIDLTDQCVVSKAPQDVANAAVNGIYPCVTNVVTGGLLSKAYTLQVSFQALGWYDLMNQFRFSIRVYLLLFTVIGVGMVVQGHLVYLINRVFTKMRHPPPFRLREFLKATAPQPAFGTLLAVVPIMFVTCVIYGWWNVLKSNAPVFNPSAYSFEGVSGDWLYIAALDAAHIKAFKAGRVGVSLLAFGMFLLLLGMKYMIPDNMDQQSEDNLMNQSSLQEPTDPFELPIPKDDEKLTSFEGEKEKGESTYWNPRAWKRANLILASCVTVLTQVAIIEFSYSATFTNKPFQYWTLYKLLEHVYDAYLGDALGDTLLCLPHSILIGLTELIITLAAPDFYGFLMGLIAMQCFMIMERLFVNPWIEDINRLMPKWKLQFHRTFRKKRRRTREQKAKEEAEWRTLCQEIDEAGAGVEVICGAFIDTSLGAASMYLSPLVMGLIYLFSVETQIAALYGILESDLMYYIIFAVVTIPFVSVLDVVLWNTQELVHGWKAYEYATYQRHRFSVRKERWILNSKFRDKSLEEGLQDVDMLCFSSQYYFLIVIYASGLVFLVFGLSIFLRQSYNPLGDVLMPVIFVLVFAFCTAVTRVCLYLGHKAKIWVPKGLRGSIDDEIAAKLAVGAGRQEDMEMERMEMAALNSERFRHRFMERNRPWILQHMVELFTPRTLQMPGPLHDGKPNIEYIRDIYNELLNMGEGRRLAGDDPNISSDDEDDLFKMRQNWSNVPVDGASRDLALYWLAKARKRMAFGKLIAGILLQHKQEACALCLKSVAGGYTMTVDIATPDGKEQDRAGLDRLIRGFEAKYGEREADSDLWKAYFRQHAVFITLCNVCVSVLEQKRLARIVAVPPRQTRADDLSSDDDDEDGIDVVFEPMVVSRTSSEGRVMSKWLQAARKRLGGVFPRDSARAEMEAYAEKMRAKKARKTKKKRVDSDDEDPSVHWKVSLTEASRAILLKWTWQARDKQFAAFRAKASSLRLQIEATAHKMHEVDDWFYSKELRLEGASLEAAGKQLLEDQLALEGDAQTKSRTATQELDAYVTEKRAAMTKEIDTFNLMLEKELASAKSSSAAKEAELAEAKRAKEVEFLELQKQAKIDNNGKVPPMLLNEHRAYLAKMDDDRYKARDDIESAAAEKAKQKQDAFNRKIALSEQGILNRSALHAHRLLAIRKEMMTALRMQEKTWQNKATSWLEKATRKVAVKEQEDAANALAAKKRKKA
ncbi:hypothetical protein SPRG_19735 [Saprolegnia parasitica CBS 223.65]|uniref:IPT/TIG domain-containing protein n=1 Tax=Saprolegnia parasitica (strain CBS 223.65) TaxID=695850 RepID=A0A067CTJ8_SAPPC|nr:hypothetical protein SPRG_19735 [Saprolegnia parasitica CBS 223.65]KDO29856.1 hypothetical protein SPRG_19735 [Saprolegnia parasitica CBS 223.65]|eukprot:XP_012199554.1 hypothetical protein SPRG_19735 [Saprolegnia parasitica CBS 223.65]